MCYHGNQHGNYLEDLVINTVNYVIEKYYDTDQSIAT